VVRRNTLTDPLSTLFAAGNKNPARRCGVRAGSIAYSGLWLEVDLASELKNSRIEG
jgi:hypothetical protein